MTALFEVELRRALSRRLVLLIVLLGIAGVLIGGITAEVKSNRTPIQIPVQGGFAVDGQKMQACVTAPDGPGGPPNSTGRIDACQSLAQVQIPNETLDRRFYMTKLKDVLGGLTAPMTLIAILIGASLIGAEWRAGTVGTTLTWEPRRTRLIGMKLLSAMIVTIAYYIFIYSFLSLALWIVAATRGTTEGADTAFARALTEQSARGLLVVAFGCVLGFALGMVARNTAGALGVGFVYVAVAEPLLIAHVSWIRRWLVIPNAAVLVRGHGVELFGYTAAKAAVKLVCYGIGLAVIAWGVFRARDVTA